PEQPRTDGIKRQTGQPLRHAGCLGTDKTDHIDDEDVPDGTGEQAETGAWRILVVAIQENSAVGMDNFSTASNIRLSRLMLHRGSSRYFWCQGGSSSAVAASVPVDPLFRQEGGDAFAAVGR